MEATPWTASAGAEPIIELKGLKKRYGEQMAVNGLDLHIAKGEIFGLLGPNGAGKTTTILMMLGLTEPTGGSVRVCGLDPARNPLTVKRRVGYMPDDVGFYEDRTALDNLMFTARLNRIPSAQARQLADRLLERVGLAEARDKKVGAFSRGMRQRLGIADVLIKQPDIVILDEPTLGIDPEGVRELLRLIRELSRQDGLTVLLSSHHLHQVQQICDRVGLFVRGELIAQGDVPSLARQLDQDGTVTVELAVGGWNDRLAETLASLPGVKEVRAENASEIDSETGAADAAQIAAPTTEDAVDTTLVALVCDRDVASEASAAIVQGGGRLLAMKRKQYGLDDIYHRYFEGGTRA
ncbi:ABC transporter ATP-binding protein [Paenibacillus methanolicus]|uniref:ABC-2 type transport system ATP-binding protein n=1 Tax=Paenibacillus methanolicus TaxID=582686 RepID=A0A5S5C5Y9_9BACL|nr:ABC transporter ATP-binding protein [Paenibacillus methanolicus]TYP74851.1 ABC-2 type transport system ATP-binding protein [Paenibacillus methanolicus]